MIRKAGLCAWFTAAIFVAEPEAYPASEIRFPDFGFSWTLRQNWFWYADSNEISVYLIQSHWNKQKYSTAFQVSFYKAAEDPLDLAKADTAFARTLNAGDATILEKLPFQGDPYALRNAYTFQWSGQTFRSENYFFKKSDLTCDVRMLADPQDLKNQRPLYDSILADIRFDLAGAIKPAPRMAKTSRAAAFRIFDPADLERLAKGTRLFDAQGRNLAVTPEAGSLPQRDLMRLRGRPVFAAGRNRE